MKVTSTSLGNPIYGGDYQRVRDFFYKPFRLISDDNGEKGEEYMWGDCKWYLTDENGTVIEELGEEVHISFWKNQRDKYEPTNKKIFVVYEPKEGEPKTVFDIALNIATFIALNR